MARSYRKEQVDAVSDSSGVSKEISDIVLNAYINIVRTEILQTGNTVSILGIAEITANPDGFIRGLANQTTLRVHMVKVARDTGYDLPMVEGILFNYREAVIDQLINMRHVNISRLVTLRLDDNLRIRSNSTEVFKDQAGVSVRSAVVPSFRRSFQDRLETMGFATSLEF